MGLHRRQAAALLLVFVLSVLAVWTVPGGGGVSEWWVASGIGACVMVISPRRHAPALFLAIGVLMWAGNTIGGRAPETGPFLGLGNALEAYLIAALLTKNWSRRPQLNSWPDLRRYFLVIASGSAIPALMSIVISLTMLDRSFTVVATWVFINHLGSNLILMLLVTTRPLTPRPSLSEVAAHIAVLAAATVITYAPNNSQSGAFLLMPVVVWAGARFPSRWAVVELIALAGLITGFAHAGIGPFAVLSGDATLVSVLAGVQSFMATSVLIAIVFATVLALERQRGIAMVAHQIEVEAATSAALDREREANRRMQDMDRAKNELISTISHELRTPLTSIVGYVELLEDDIDLASASRADLLGRVSRNADRLLALAKDVLRIAAVDEREWTPTKEMIDLRRCVLSAQDAAFVPSARREELRVRVEVPDHEVTVHADPREIERIVFNFVSNAIKFTPGPGSVRVWLDKQGTTARISVEDTGLGIPTEDQTRIFERFFRSSIARQRAVPGTGLGLSIARSIADAHGGSLGFVSKEGEGTTFWLDLPMVPESTGSDPR